MGWILVWSNRLENRFKPHRLVFFPICIHICTAKGHINMYMYKNIFDLNILLCKKKNSQEYVAGCISNFDPRYGILSPCWSVLDFWKINLKKSSSTNWIFSLFQTWFLLPVYSCVACKNQFRKWFLLAKNPVCPTWFFHLDFSKFKYRSTGGLCPSKLVNYKQPPNPTHTKRAN